MGLMELSGRKVTIPMINLTIDLTKRNDPWSVYVMGVFSGITSSCCTPVLAGILTLSFLSPSFLWAGLAGLSYVFGMVVPLVVFALILEKVNWTKLSHLRGKTDTTAGVLFILVGITFTILALTGNITMGVTQPLEQMMGANVASVVRVLRTIPGSEVLFALLLLAIIGYIVKRRRKS